MKQIGGGQSTAFRLKEGENLNYQKYLAYIEEAKNYDSAEKIMMKYGFPPDCEFTAEGLAKVFDIIFAVSRLDFQKIIEVSGRNPSTIYTSLNIPARTIQHWLSGDRNPADYIIKLIGFALISECEQNF